MKLPARVKTWRSRRRCALAKPQAAQKRSIEVSVATVRELTLAEAGASTRDAAELLGVSHQLVHKYAKDEAPAANSNAARSSAQTAASPTSSATGSRNASSS